MPAQTVSNKQSILKKLQSAAPSIAGHASDETKYGGIVELPPGIDGVAQVTKVEIVEIPSDTDKKQANGNSAAGELQVQLEAVIRENYAGEIEHNGRLINVVGLHTRKYFPLYDTKTQAGKIRTRDEYIADVMNEFRKLGGEDYTSDCTDAGDLLAKCEGLTQGQPYFRFSTNAGKPSPAYPTPRIWENWNGAREIPPDYAPPTDDEGVVKDTSKPAPAPAAKTPAKPAPSKPAPAPEPSQEPDAPDLDDLLARANDNDTEAQDALKAICYEKGYTEEDCDGADSWEQVKGWAEGDAKEEGSEEPEQFVPTKDGVCKYHPIDQKTKKPAAKAVDCKVVSVNSKKATAEIRNLTTKAVYKDVPWSELEAA